MGLGNFGLGCQCCGDGGGDDDPTCGNGCIEQLVLFDDDFVWQGVAIHTIDFPVVGWCPTETKRITVRGYSEVGTFGDIWPGFYGSGKFGSPGSYSNSGGYPWIRLESQGGGIRVVDSSHNLATVTRTLPTATPVTLPYTMPGTGAQIMNLAFDIPRVNYDDPFDYTVWIDVEFLPTTIVCGNGPTRTFISARFGTWYKEFGPDNFKFRWVNSTGWQASYGCECPLPDPV